MSLFSIYYYLGSRDMSGS